MSAQQAVLEQAFVWVNPGQDGFNILSISPAGLATANIKKKMLPMAAEQLGRGVPADAVLGKDATLVPLQSLERVEMAEHTESIEFAFALDGKAKAVSFTPANGKAERQQIYEVARLAFGPQGREELSEAGFWSAAGGYLVAVFIALVLGVAMIFTAGELEAGKEVKAEGRRSGMKALLIGAARMFGTGGSIAVTALVLAVLGYLIYSRLSNRPKIAVLTRI